MMAGDERAPRSGTITRYLMRRRLGPSQRELLQSELDELYEHRAESQGRADADRWLRREYRSSSSL